LAERADVGVGARLDELDGVGQQGFSFPQCLRIPAGRQQVKTPGEMPRASRPEPVVLAPGWLCF
jgi:hypothetical protein